MLKRLLILLFCCMTSISVCYAGGNITHMFLAQEAIKKLPDPVLRNLLLNNLDAYLVGAVYPDSGYIKGTNYGEDSHWDPFIFTFADYLNAKYSDPVTQNPKLVAFLFGCASHRVSDEIIHRTFYSVAKDKDFKGDFNAAHTYGDIGIDILVNIDKNQWRSEPAIWWVPVADLVEIYHRMGKDEYTADQIAWGNTVIAYAGFGERLIAIAAYLPLIMKMPWTAYHYYDWPQGGMLMDKDSITDYQINLWNALKQKTQHAQHVSQAKIVSHSLHDQNIDSPLTNLTEDAIKSGVITLDNKKNQDGSVEILPPIVNQAVKLQSLISKYLGKFL